jgi:CAAX prenyl protease-like protein
LIPRIAPFGAYLAFIALAQSVKWVAAFVPEGWTWISLLDLWMYPTKIAVVLGLLVYYWPCYEELSVQGRAGVNDGVLAVVVGLAVYVLWVRMDWPWAVQGRDGGYDPYRAGPQMGPVLAGLRLFGAAVVVPIMEELFWRSFLLRYLISSRFESVKLGTFTPFSFIASVVLFGVEHELWLAGIMAGTAYTLLLYRTRKLWPCILGHAVTNLALGFHVLSTQQWRWW